MRPGLLLQLQAQLVLQAQQVRHPQSQVLQERRVRTRLLPGRPERQVQLVPQGRQLQDRQEWEAQRVRAGVLPIGVHSLIQQTKPQLQQPLPMLSGLIQQTQTAIRSAL